MRFPPIFTALALSSALFSSGAIATTFYVSQDGDDDDDGSEPSPFASFAHASSQLSAGDELIIRAGTYRETLTISTNGTRDNPIVVRAATGENVTIKGTKPLSNWSQYSGDIYQTSVRLPLGVVFNQIYHNDELMTIARWPNDSDNDRFTIDAHPLTRAGTTSSFNVENMPAGLDLSGAYVWYLGGHSGTSWTREITAYTSSSISFDEINVEQWPFSNHTPTKRTDGSYGQLFVFGDLALLDQGREWVYDDSSETLYFQSADGSMPSDGEVEYAERKHALVLDGDYVRAEGLTIFGANVRLNGDYTELHDSQVLHGRQRLNDLNGRAQVNDASVEVNGTYTRIENNSILHGSLNGIYVYNWDERGQYAHIEGNTIRYFDSEGIHATPLRVLAANVKILQNTISHTGRDGMFVIGTDSEIAYNDVSHSALINNDTGIFYTVGNDNDKNIHIHHNWWHDAMGRDYHDKRIAGIYLDNDSKGFLVHHNVVWNIPWSGLQLNWDTWNNNMYHNTLYNVDKAMGAWVNGRVQRDNRVWNNFSNKNDWLRNSGYDLDSNYIDITVPQLADPSVQNFMPVSSSQLTDQARIIDGFTKPYVGPAPDIGAYELGGTAWVPGVNAVLDTCSGCASDPSDPPVATPTPSPTSMPTPVATPSASPMPTPSSAPSTSGSGGGGSTGSVLFILLSLCLYFRKVKHSY